MKNYKKWGLGTLILIAVLVLTVSLAGAESSLGVTGPCYAMLSPTTTATEMAVTWWDVPEVTAGSVQYTTSSGFGGEVFTAEGTLTNNDTGSGYSAFCATMTGLSANTTYYYRVGNEGAWSGEMSFTTGDATADSFSFMYLGDIQYASYSTATTDYAAWGDLVEGAYDTFPDLDFAILGGDMVQQGQSALNWQWFYDNASPVFASLPVLAVPGNHESNSAVTGKPELFLKLFALPANGPEGFKEEFYSYDRGDCHILCLSSSIFMNEQLINGSMTEDDFDTIADWISDDLSDSEATWKIVVMHHPAYAVVDDDTATEVLANWAPIFVDEQVDLVLCGHQHIYMRTNMIKGVTYVMGNSGSKHYAPAEVSYSACMISDTSNYEIISADDSELTLTAYDASGNSLDTVTLAVKDRSVTPYFPEDHLGDLDGDGYLTATDVSLLMNAICTNAAYCTVNDVNEDGNVDVCDAHNLALTCE